MDLRQGETILKIFRHHPTPFIIQVFKVILTFIPIYLIIYFSRTLFSTSVYILINLIFFFFVFIVLIYISLIYWLDALIITNERVIFIDYKLLSKSDESQAFINDIQDIVTHEKGILSYFWIFDYGTIKMDTPASGITVEFINAPDPEGIRQFVFHIKKQ